MTPLILGHRGSSAVTPENTLAAFSRALSDGADGIEFDVRLSRDGVPVVIHDATLKRTALIDGCVSELTAEQLREIDVGRWQAGNRITAGTTAEQLPLLAQVYDLFRDTDGLLYVEMKCEQDEGPTLAAEVIRLTREFGLADRVVVESFDLAAIAAIKLIDQGIRTAALFEPRISRPLASIRRLRIVDAARGVRADEIALHRTLAGPALIDKALRAGFEIVVWTVDDPAWIERARLLGVKALIANDPAAMLRHRAAL
ncbi:MAG TPA: glycerophosphodiester phosphodiesterase family protein [Pyrinomonadaceae bacterium]|nr:glycerophosphodiester phosphodiesterase family protein [Pyrinomonadaceae bacterium]